MYAARTAHAVHILNMWLRTMCFVLLHDDCKAGSLLGPTPELICVSIVPAFSQNSRHSLRRSFPLDYARRSGLAVDHLVPGEGRACRRISSSSARVRLAACWPTA